MVQILSSCERVRHMRRSFTARWDLHVIADPVVNRTEGVFGDGGLGLDSVDFMISKKKKKIVAASLMDCTVKLSDFLDEQVHVARCSTLLLTEVWRHLASPLLRHRVFPPYHSL